MAEGRQRSQWDQTAVLWHAIAEPNRNADEQPRPFSPADVHPYRTREDYEPDVSNLAELGRLIKAVNRNGSRSN